MAKNLVQAELDRLLASSKAGDGALQGANALLKTKGTFPKTPFRGNAFVLNDEFTVPKADSESWWGKEFGPNQKFVAAAICSGKRNDEEHSFVLYLGSFIKEAKNVHSTIKVKRGCKLVDIYDELINLKDAYNQWLLLVGRRFKVTHLERVKTSVEDFNTGKVSTKTVLIPTFEEF